MCAWARGPGTALTTRTCSKLRFSSAPDARRPLAVAHRRWGRGGRAVILLNSFFLSFSARGQVVASAGEGGAIRLTRREPDSLPGSPPAPPGCTSYPGPPSCSACSGRLMPHQSPGLKHSLTRTSPRLRRTRTPSCAPRSSGSSTCSWPPAPLVGVGARHGEEPDAEGADYPRSPSSASACPRLRAVRARVQSTSCAREQPVH